MIVRVIPLLGAVSIGGLAAFTMAGPPTTLSSPVTQTSWNAGVLPVPGQGPPGAVAAVGANPMMVSPPGISIPNPAPLVAGKFLLPQGARVTVFPGSELSKMLDAPIVVGMRPGYDFRFELSGLPYNPGKSLFPEVELRGVLVPRHGMKYMDYPIPLAFTQVDIDLVLRGGLLTKVIYLEDPEKALPAATNPNFPVETLDVSTADAINNAKKNGRLMAIVR
ncbi:MAG TPA: hypothetical protein VG097_12655, partial [Gemmata sp.]|nr:hypothetical protein [Gemmata sp.]